MLIHDLLRVMWHSAALYVGLLVVFRLTGKRQLAELTAPELLAVALLGTAVEMPLVAGDLTLAAGLVSAGTLFVLNWGLSKALRQWPWLRRSLLGRPVLLIHEGRLLEKNLRSAGLTEDDVREGIRKRGLPDDFAKIRLAVMERDGMISVVRHS